MAERGKNFDTLFSEFWTKVHQDVQGCTPYQLMQWAFRAGLDAQRDRMKLAAGREGERDGN